MNRDPISKPIFRPRILLRLALLFSLCSLLSLSANAQARISVDSAISIALADNMQFAINQSEIESVRYDARTANDISKTGIFVENEDLRPSDHVGILKIGLSQSLSWPGFYIARKQYLAERLKYTELNTEVINASVRRDVRLAYYQLWYLQEKKHLLLQLDSIYSNISNAAKLRVKTGDVAPIDQVAAEVKANEMAAFVAQNEQDIVIQQRKLMLLLNRNENLLPLEAPLTKLSFSLEGATDIHPLLGLQDQLVTIAAKDVAVQKNANWPELSGRAFSQRIWGADNPFTGFSVMASFPLLNIGASRNKVKAAIAEKDVQERKLDYQKQLLENEKATAIASIQKNDALMEFYSKSGLEQSRQIVEAAMLSYKAGEISFAELSQFLGQAVGIRQGYLDALNNFNNSVIHYNYFNNQ